MRVIVLPVVVGVVILAIVFAPLAFTILMEHATEQAFCAELNRALEGTGAKVTSCRFHP